MGGDIPTPETKVSRGDRKVEVPGPLGRRPRRFRVFLRQILGPFRIVLGEALGRLLDILGAACALIVLSPLALARGFLAFKSARSVFERIPRLGRFRTRFDELQFSGSAFGKKLPLLFNILKGDLSFTGPRALSPQEAAAIPVFSSVRFEVRPGLVSPYRLRKRTGVAYETEPVSDRDFVYSESLGGNIGLLARSIPGAILGGGAEFPAPPVFSIFDVPIVNTTMDEAIEWILTRVETGQPCQLAFVNPDCLNISYKNKEYAHVLQRAARVLPDGIGIHLGCRILGTPLRANVNGTDLFPRLCEQMAAKGGSIYLLGARPGIARAAADAMVSRFPSLRIAGTRDGFFEPAQTQSVIGTINESGASVLLVAMGAPRQDLWIARHSDELRVPVSMGVGGLFDFYSGRIPRAPQWMRDIGMEWIYRLSQEPGRMWKRYIIGNPLFLSRVLKEARSRRVR